MIKKDNRCYVSSSGIRAWLMCLVFYIIDLLLITDMYDFLSAIVKGRSTRFLNEKEMAIATDVFEKSIKLDYVKIDAKAIIASKKLNIYYVSMHTINAWGAISDALLIHELVHVWQYQRFGLVYIYFALKAQQADDTYDYGGTQKLISVRQQKGLLSDFNFEQQASIIEDYYRLMSSDRVGKAQLEVYAYFVNQLQ